MKEQLKSLLYGAAIGDAMGVPFEYKSRKKMREKPCIGMTGFGTHWMPKGTWSDATGMLLATVNGLKPVFDKKNILKEYKKWFFLGKYMPDRYDAGTIIRRFMLKSLLFPLDKIRNNKEKDNGNGSLMRIAPVAYYLLNEGDITKRYGLIRQVSEITHAHELSCICCLLYCEFLRFLLLGMNKKQAYTQALQEVNVISLKEWSQGEFNQILQCNIYECNEDDIASSGYVIDSLKTALWCVLTTESYEECVLKAVNLGGDTDTIACISGAAAGILYGYESIPKEWMMQLRKKKIIEKTLLKYALTNKK